MIPSKRTCRSLAAVLAALCVMLRAAVPPGYMPGKLSNGAWAVPCPSGFPAAWFATSNDRAAGDAHAHHHPTPPPPGDRSAGGDTGAHIGLDDHCPLGEALKSPALPLQVAVAIPTPATLPRLAPADAEAVAGPVAGLPGARAPPLS